MNKKHGGKTSTTDWVLLYTVRHQLAIHRRGWTLEPRRHHYRPNKDKTKVLHNHGPPVRPGVNPRGLSPCRPVTSVMPMSGSVSLGRTPRSS